jgi:MbtH protein
MKSEEELLPDDWVVLINDDEQYCLWPASNEIPSGWHPARPAGSKAEALAYVELHWTDMRPKSLRH